jgi:hypothetical protein
MAPAYDMKLDFAFRHVIVFGLMPFPCGDWPDLRIARDSLIYRLDHGEMYLADGGYYDRNQWSVMPSGFHEFSDKQKSVVRARHETINKRFKQ